MSDELDGTANYSRRGVLLAGSAVGVAALAGCTDDDPADDTLDEDDADDDADGADDDVEDEDDDGGGY